MDALLAGGVALFVTALELVTTTYPRTIRFVLSSVFFYCYIVIYGIIAGGVYLLLPALSDQVTFVGINMSNPWVQALAVGLSVKALLHIRIFSVSTGPGRTFPLGLETLVLLFEPWMLRTIEIDHFNNQTAFVDPLAKKYATLKDAQDRALNGIPNTFTDAEKAALRADISQATTSKEVIEAYLKYVGVKAVKTAFPL